MTYRRTDGTWAAAMTDALRAGPEWLAERIGLSTSRLRQCANPVRAINSRPDTVPLAIACEIDVACAERGLGTPLFNEYRRRLVETGALHLSSPERRAQRLAQAIRAAAVALFAALEGEPRLAGVAA
jgi:hypothetical protein